MGQYQNYGIFLYLCLSVQISEYKFVWYQNFHGVLYKPYCVCGQEVTQLCISISLILHKFLQDGCNSRLSEWFEENKITWVTTLASVVAVQIMSCGIALYMLSRVKRINKLKWVSRLCTFAFHAERLDKGNLWTWTLLLLHADGSRRRVATWSLSDFSGIEMDLSEFLELWWPIQSYKLYNWKNGWKRKQGLLTDWIFARSRGRKSVDCNLGCVNSSFQEVPHRIEEATVRLVVRGEQRLQAEDLMCECDAELSVLSYLTVQGWRRTKKRHAPWR